VASSVKLGSHVICFLFIIYREEGIHYGYLHDGARTRLVTVASIATGQDCTVSPSVGRTGLYLLVWAGLDCIAQCGQNWTVSPSVDRTGLYHLVWAGLDCIS